MALVVTTHLWGDAYGPKDVARLAAGLRRGLTQPYRFVCVTDRDKPLDLPGVEQVRLRDGGLTKMKGCFARLRLFDPEFQMELGADDRIVSIDLDVVVTGKLDQLFMYPNTFMILKGANASNPCPFNGSLFMVRAGAHREIWDDFSLDAIRGIKFHEFPDDQGWFWDKLPNAAGWQVGSMSGVYAFQKPGWPNPKSEELPSDARLVVFIGWRKPNKFKHVPWIRENWLR
jgi:hypothetical protein